MTRLILFASLLILAGVLVFNRANNNNLASKTNGPSQPVLVAKTNSASSSGSVLGLQGCCSHHGGVSYCDSSVGSWVCNDGEYSPTCGCAYAPPVVYKPSPPECSSSSNATWTFSKNSDNTCNQDVSVTWSGCGEARYYSLGLSKYPGADPGPNSDTLDNSFTFSNKASGKWFFNLKPGNQNGWGKVWYWEVEVPEIVPQLEATLSDGLINYTTSCVKSLKITPDIFDISDVNQGVISLSTTAATTYKLEAQDFSGNIITKDLLFDPNSPNINDQVDVHPQENSTNTALIWAAAVAVIGIIGFKLIKH